MRITLTHDQVAEIADIIGLGLGAEIRTGYIGRGPTRPCLAIVGGPREMLQFTRAAEKVLSEDLEWDVEEVRDAFSAPVSDDMGRDTVFYWTNVTVE